MTRSDVPVMSKTDLAPRPCVDHGMARIDLKVVRAGQTYALADLRHGHRLEEIVSFVRRKGGLGWMEAREEVCLPPDDLL